MPRPEQKLQPRAVPVLLARELKSGLRHKAGRSQASHRARDMSGAPNWSLRCNERDDGALLLVGCASGPHLAQLEVSSMQARGAVEAPSSGSLKELMARLHAGPHLQERPHGTGSRRFGHRLRQLALLHFAKP